MLTIAKLLIILDVQQFYHLMRCPLLITFNPLFEMFRWKRMPFSIRFLPELFQRRMHEVGEGLSGVQEAADDFTSVKKGTFQVMPT